jgi:hypothetical protein
MGAKNKRKSRADNAQDVEVIRRPKSACVGATPSSRKKSPRKGRPAPKRKKRSRKKNVVAQLARPLLDHGTQFTRTPGSERLPVVIGLDFGTASTKVIIRVPYFLGGKAYAVPFDAYCSSENPYLLPSRLLRMADGSFRLGGRTGGKNVIPNIKGMLMGTIQAPPDHDAVELATSFLALVLQEIRRWFLRSTKNTHGDHQVSWSLQIGIPAAGHDRDDCRNRFLRAARAAWLASLCVGRPDTQTVRRAIEETANPDAELPDCEFVDAVPEVAAAAVGYARSDHRREGLHFLIDIGATTLDVCGFKLESEGAEDHYKLYSADITRHGTSFLQRARFSALSEIGVRADPLAPIPACFLGSLPDCQFAQSAIDEVENEFAGIAQRTMSGVLWHVRKDRYPEAPAWKEGVPILACGGGSKVSLFQSMIGGLDSWLRERVVGCPGARFLTLERPRSDQFEGDIDEREFHRLAVAWGLSYPDIEIGEITRPGEIEDVELIEVRKVFPNYTGAEQM